MKQEMRIEGMYCPHCEKRIETALTALEGIESVHADFAAGTAIITGERKVERSELECVLIPMGYALKDNEADLTRNISLIIILLGLSFILDRLGLLNRLVPRQLGESGMSYGLFFLTGLLTSVHCTAMCGGICLSQSLPGKGRWASCLYNAGRVVSYTLIGGILGLLGRLIGGANLTISPLVQGCVKLAAGFLMLLAGVNLLGLFPALRKFHLCLPGLHVSSRLPFVVGLLNGLMPCGPLQAMQLASLGSGSLLSGALAMLCFSLGTVPLMVFLGSIAAFLGRWFTRSFNTIAALLVSLFGIAMLIQGAALSGMISNWQLWIVLLGIAVLGLISLIPTGRTFRLGLCAFVAVLSILAVTVYRPVPISRPEGTVRIVDGVQYVSSMLEPGQYPDIKVQMGLPVRWTIYAEESSINGCNAQLIIPSLDLTLRFQPGENVLEFTPKTPETIPYSCWMGMIRGNIIVTEQE